LRYDFRCTFAGNLFNVLLLGFCLGKFVFEFNASWPSFCAAVNASIWLLRSAFSSAIVICQKNKLI
jgi:hypothetical protein